MHEPASNYEALKILPMITQTIDLQNRKQQSTNLHKAITSEIQDQRSTRKEGEKKTYILTQ